MKLKNIFLFFAIVAYSCLFYQQTAGINFLIFSSLLLAFSGVINPDLLRNRNWQMNFSDTVLPELQSLLHNPKVNLSGQVNDYTIYGSIDGYERSTPIISQREFINRQITKFKENYKKKDWQSWNYDDKRVFEEVKLGGI